MGLHNAKRMGTLASADYVAGAEYEGHCKNIRILGLLTTSHLNNDETGLKFKHAMQAGMAKNKNVYKDTQKGVVSFRPPSVEGFKIISVFVHEISRYFSSPPKCISVFIHGYCSCFHPRQQCRSQRPHGLRCGSAGFRLQGLRLRIPPGAWMSFVKRSPTE